MSSQKPKEPQLLLLGVFLYYYYKNKLLQPSKSPRDSKIEIDMTIDLQTYIDYLV